MKIHPPLEELLRGTPETILPEVTPKSILITWQHTNEELAPRAMHHILTHRPDLAPYVGYICGNPLTAATNPDKGFTETDLNRSYAVNKPVSYEEKQAVKLLELSKQYPYVLDLHGTVGDTPEIIIVAENRVHEPAVQKLIAASTIKNIVVMPRHIADSSLIGVTDNAIVMEYYIDNLAQGIRDAETVIENIVHDTSNTPFERQYFYVTETVPKSADPGLDAKNFEFVQDEHGGYYPVMLGSGSRSYREDPTKNYCCFAARRKDVAIL